MTAAEIGICAVSSFALFKILLWLGIGKYKLVRSAHKPFNPPKICFDKGFLLPVLRSIFYCFHYLSVHRYIPYLCYKRRYIAVEIYVIAWLSIEIVLFLLTKEPIVCSVCASLLSAVICYRLFDLFQSWVSQFVLGQESDPVNPLRTLILVLIGYAEIAISYAIITFVFSNTFSTEFTLPFHDIGDAFYYSLSTAIAIGSEWRPESVGSYFIFGTQIIFTLLFLTAVVNRVFAYITRRG